MQSNDERRARYPRALSPFARVLRPASRFLERRRDQAAGAMFWFTRNRFSGSYLRFTCASSA